MNRLAVVVLLGAAVALVAAVALLSQAVVQAERERTLREVERLALWRLDARATALVIATASRTAAWDSLHLALAPPGPAAPPAPQPTKVNVTPPVAPLVNPPAVNAALEVSADIRNDYGSRAANLDRAQMVQQAPKKMKSERSLATSVEPQQRSVGLATASKAVVPLVQADEQSEQDNREGLALSVADSAQKAVQVSAPAPVEEFMSAPAGGSDLGVDHDDASREVAAEALPGPVRAQWIGNDLVLVRERSQRQERLRLDWTGLRAELRAVVVDLLPGADVVMAGDDSPLRLAALPVALVPGLVPIPELSTATRWTLGGAWLIACAGVVGAVALTVVALRLAQRRAAFVSAVTHELRTPLTALRLHGDLLADERVANDPVKRGARIAVIRAEATRLAHLVDNVLDYARLERRRPPLPQVVSLAEVIAPLLPRLEERLSAVGLTLIADALPPAHVRCDAAAVERILVNLVDNAAKYASGARDQRVWLRVLIGARHVSVRLVDAGPGIPNDVRPRLFVPFARSAEIAAGNAPGVGLGLSLCRRLARAQGGDVRLVDTVTGSGCSMELLLPLG